MSKKVFLQTFGCQMNVRDSEVICGLLEKAGYKITEDEDKAEIAIFNTCSVRQHAEEKVWSAVGRSKAKIIGVIGCMANNYREAIFEKAPKVDFVVGTADIAKIPAIIAEIKKHKGSLLEKKIYETDANFREDEIYHTGFHLDRTHAFVVISEGCENYCSYCVVPYVRGKLRFRSSTDILDEIREDIEAGIEKITLLGQNVNAYKSDGVNFVKLVKLVNPLQGLKEFSFITSHPKDTSKELFQAMADLEKLKKCLHLPIQSGSDRILKLMNRNYTRKSYIDLVEDYRRIVSNGELSTDIIVGFPTESEQDFQDTYDLVKEVEFNSAYIFKYSPRPHTEAAKMADTVPKEEKEKRHKLILDLQKKISHQKKCQKRK
ncbi:MAG: tRNA (N6-isopentenyl adenosine(37)-C2)-methylthiotransferase MiaB [Candidatus Omnitrophica bacterium]|nr:tRNA (N6-isopentenyl adenosine(37)-C2)-methylthiotransferase MiaB [Candidatus Omnitrophota bacterium]MDD5653788.1 tRNA (N6-isopentenyl adenosine(37)-C2)-methylthiotransferase MiaB [Candidatus Omnitrophota bacterium]